MALLSTGLDAMIVLFIGLVALKYLGKLSSSDSKYMIIGAIVLLFEAVLSINDFNGFGLLKQWTIVRHVLSSTAFILVFIGGLKLIVSLFREAQ